MIERFEELLKELGKAIHLSLHSDKNHACSIRLHGSHLVQLELDPSQENLLLFTKIVDLPPGKFREIVLREALKANSFPDPRPGILAYYNNTNHLVLYQRYSLLILNGERLASFLSVFVELADLWRKAIEGGRAAPHPIKP